MTTLIPASRRIPTSVRFTEAEAEAVRVAAARRRLSVSDYLREVANEASAEQAPARVVEALTAITLSTGLDAPTTTFRGEWTATTPE